MCTEGGEIYCHLQLFVYKHTVSLFYSVVVMPMLLLLPVVIECAFYVGRL